MTLRDDARTVLSGWTAPDPEQDQLRLAYLAHLERHADAMSRDCHPDHLTASVLIVDHLGGQVLLTLHRRLKRWLQTGGHCEADDATLAEAALREGREESGIHELSIDPVPVLLSRHEVPGCGPIRPSHHLDVQYLAVAPAGARHVISDESEDLAWFDLDALPETDQSVRDLIAAATTRLRENPEPSPTPGRPRTAPRT